MKVKDHFNYRCKQVGRRYKRWDEGTHDTEYFLEGVEVPLYPLPLVAGVEVVVLVVVLLHLVIGMGVVEACDDGGVVGGGDDVESSGAVAAVHVGVVGDGVDGAHGVGHDAWDYDDDCDGVDSLSDGGEVGLADRATNVLDDVNDDGEEVGNDDVHCGDYDGVGKSDAVHHHHDDVDVLHRHGEDDDELLQVLAEEEVVVLNEGVSWGALEQQLPVGARAFRLEPQRSLQEDIQQVEGLSSLLGLQPFE